MVASMNQHEEIFFPKLDVSIDVVRHDGKPTMINVRTPEAFLGEGFVAKDWPSVSADELDDHQRSVRRHALCNSLHVASMSLDILYRQVADGETEAMEQTLEIVVNSLSELERVAPERPR